nr:MAG TPA: hypothetical protein [Bacteriophage sp.]
MIDIKKHRLNLKPIKKWLNLLNQILCINGGPDVNMKLLYPIGHRQVKRKNGMCINKLK